MADYRLLSFESDGVPRAGLAVGERVRAVADLTGVSADDSVFGILQDWAQAEGRLERAASRMASDGSGGMRLEDVRLLAPILYPVSVFCAGANYHDHVKEMAAASGVPPDPNIRAAGLKPWHFIRPTGSMAGPGTNVPIPAGCHKFDYEVELVAVIGRAARNVSIEQALDYVAGYTVADDVSARDMFTREPLARTAPFYWDWISQKCNEDSCPVGPWIVPAKAIPDPQQVGIGLSLNDAVKQDSNTSQMVFSLAEQLSHLSTRVTLRAGDMILTGTPAGVGMGRGEFLKSGDRIEAWVDGIGKLEHGIA